MVVPTNRGPEQAPATLRRPHGLVVVLSGKGGVSKTETAVDLGGALAHIDVKPDAFLDLDYGASLTRRLGYTPKSGYAAAFLDGKISFEKAVLETDEGIGIIATNAQISETPKGKTIPWRDQLIELKKNRLIVADTSDDIMSAPVAAAILAADIIVIPIPLDDTAYERTFPEIRGILAAHKHRPEEICFAALVDRQTKYSEEVEKAIAADGIELVGRVPRGVAAKEARRKNLSVVKYAKNSAVAKAYIDLAKIVYARLQKMHGQTGSASGREMPELEAAG
jgi:cellulose biosynthesis protein BcsQ